jgi:hypothetical protein
MGVPLIFVSDNSICDKSASDTSYLLIIITFCEPCPNVLANVKETSNWDWRYVHTLVDALSHRLQPTDHAERPHG